MLSKSAFEYIRIHPLTFEYSNKASTLRRKKPRKLCTGSSRESRRPISKLISTRMRPCTTESGLVASETGEVPCAGWMVPSMKASGTTGMLLARGNSITLMATSTRANGRTTRPTGLEHTLMPREPGMRGIGRMISSTGSAWRSGMKGPSTRATMRWARKRAEESTRGQMAQHMKASGSTTRSTEKVYTSGKTGAGIMASGKRMTWKVMVSISGPMDADMRASTQMTRSVAMASIIGQMAVGMRAGGSRGNSTASGCTWTQAKRR